MEWDASLHWLVFTSELSLYPFFLFLIVSPIYSGTEFSASHMEWFLRWFLLVYCAIWVIIITLSEKNRSDRRLQSQDLHTAKWITGAEETTHLLVPEGVYLVGGPHITEGWDSCFHPIEYDYSIKFAFCFTVGLNVPNQGSHFPWVSLNYLLERNIWQIAGTLFSAQCSISSSSAHLSKPLETQGWEMNCWYCSSSEQESGGWRYHHCLRHPWTIGGSAFTLSFWPLFQSNSSILNETKSPLC